MDTERHGPKRAAKRDDMRARITVVLILIATVGCSGRDLVRAAPAHSAASRLPLQVCEIEGIAEPLLCGTLEVPENRETKDGRLIPISIIVVPSKTPNPERRAWIEHPGGPRYSTVATAHYFADGGWLEGFRRNQDIVLVDVRGLHESGALYCEALKFPRILERYYPPEKVQACRKELESRVGLEHYSTANAIKDYEEIRTWLGYEKWNVGGWSFGSRFMLTYLHLYPESIRTVSLLIPATLNFERPLDYARFGQKAFDALVGACLSDEECSAAFPSISTDLDTLLHRLETSPVTVEIKNPISGLAEDRQLTRNIVAETVWIWLLDVAKSRELPYILHHAARNNFAPFIELAVPQSAPEPEPEGHYFSVVCPEETGRLSMEQAEAAAINTFVGGYIAKDYIEACEAWGRPPKESHPVTPAVFDVPALIVTGEFDPVTAPEYGDVNADHFRDALHLTVPQMAHGVSGMSNAACLTNILTSFVEQGSIDKLDTTCVGTMRPPPFRVKDRSGHDI